MTVINIASLSLNDNIEHVRSDRNCHTFKMPGNGMHFVWLPVQQGQQVVVQRLIDSGSRLENVHELGAAHAKSTAYRPKGNGRIERQVGLTLQGARAALLQAGLPHALWPFADEHWATAFNATSSRGIGDPTPWRRRFGGGTGHLQAEARAREAEEI